MVQNAMLYVWGVIFNGTNWILSAMPSADHHGPPTELFGDVGGVQVFPWFLRYLWLIHLHHPQKIRCYYSYVY